MKIFDPAPIALATGLAIIRIVFGLLLIYHGQELFHREIMAKYLSWDTFQGPAGEFLVYTGKIGELLAGFSLFLGVFTRIGAILCIGTMSFITFVVGHGKFWYEDQHPFMFVLFGVLFLFSGPGTWSVDGRRGVKMRNAERSR